MKGELRRLNSGDWTKIEYERLVGGILIINAQEMIDDIKGALVEIRLEKERERVGLANKYGGIIFETDETCPTCERLWKELSEATKAHAAILRKWERADIKQNRAVVTELEPIKQEMAERPCQSSTSTHRTRRHQSTRKSNIAKELRIAISVNGVKIPSWLASASRSTATGENSRLTTVGSSLFEASANALDFFTRDFWKGAKPEPANEAQDLHVAMNLNTGKHNAVSKPHTKKVPQLVTRPSGWCGSVTLAATLSAHLRLATLKLKRYNPSLPPLFSRNRLPSRIYLLTI